MMGTNDYEECLKCVQCGVWSMPDNFESDSDTCICCCIELYDPIEEVEEE